MPRLLPVTITTPTVTPTRRLGAVAAPSRAGRARSRTATAESCVEILVGEDTRLCLHGDARRAVLVRIPEWLPNR